MTSIRLGKLRLPANARTFPFGSGEPPAPPPPPYTLTVDDVVYWQYGAPLRTDGLHPTWGKHEAVITADPSFDWYEGGRPGVVPPYPSTYQGLVYTAHNIWGQVMPIAGGMPAAHRDVRIQVDFPQVWHLESGAWVSKKSRSQLGSLDGGYWNADPAGTFSKTTDWVSSEPNPHWRTEADGFGYSFDCKPMTNADGTPKPDTAIAHFFWNGFNPRTAIQAGAQVAIVCRYRLITDNQAVDLAQARFIGAFSGDAFETTTTTLGSNGRNPALAQPRHKIIGPEWVSVGHVTGTEAQIRAYPTMPFLRLP